MPSRSITIVICLMWLLVTGWFVKQEILPRVAPTDLVYERVLRDRAVEEHTEWSLDIDGTSIGYAEFLIQPQPDRTIQLRTNFRLTDGLFESFRFGTKSVVYRDWRLHSFVIELVVPAPDQTTNRIELIGEVTEDELILRVEGASNAKVPKESRFRINPKNLVMNTFIPVDRIPNLAVGKEWTSRSFNPIALIPGPTKWLMSSEPFETVTNKVLRQESIRVNEQDEFCSLIQHKADSGVTHTWVRVSDDRVVRREVLLPGLLTLTGNAGKLTFNLRNSGTRSQIQL